MLISSILYNLAYYIFFMFQIGILMYGILKWLPSLQQTYTAQLTEMTVAPYVNWFKRWSFKSLDLSILLAYISFRLVSFFALNGLSLLLNIMDN